MITAQRSSSLSVALADHVPAKRPKNADLIEQLTRQWGHSEAADARAVLGEHPELRARKSVVLELAYEEFCRRHAAGEAPDPEAFCERFPSFKASLGRLIEAHQFVYENSYIIGNIPEVPWPGVGETYLGFALRHELGHGAFARVFLASEPALGQRRVAVKVSRQGSAEAKTLGRIHHPNIVPVHSVQRDPATGLTVVCMPYLGNATLYDVLDRLAESGLPAKARTLLDVVREVAVPDEPVAECRIPDPVLARGTYLDGVIRLGSQLAEALAYIHDMGICHRDVKPSNVLLCPDGRPMLLDFNLSFDEYQADRRPGGTLPYMSPEQLLALNQAPDAEPASIDARSDIFSLGMILYELATGAHPFGPVPLNLHPPEMRKLLLQRHQAGFRPIRELNPQVEKGFAQLVEHCLAPNPDDRPQTAAEIARALRQALSAPRRVHRWAALHPRAVAAALILTFAVAATGAYGVAAQDAYPVREHHQGQAAVRQGDFPTAIFHLSRAIEAEPKNVQFLFDRGRAYLRLRDNEWARARAARAGGDEKQFTAHNLEAESLLEKARGDFKTAEPLTADNARIHASYGFCLSLCGHEPAAIIQFKKALDKGFAPATMNNNIGYCYMLASTRRADLEEARRYLDQALAIDPGLQAAYYNRALVDLHWSDNEETYIPRQGIADILKARDLGPVDGQFLGNALRLHAIAASRDPAELQLADQSLDLLQRALEYGENPEQYSRLREIFANDARFQPLLRQPAKLPVDLPPVTQVVDPSQDLFD